MPTILREGSIKISYVLTATTVVCKQFYSISEDVRLSVMNIFILSVVGYLQPSASLSSKRDYSQDVRLISSQRAAWYTTLMPVCDFFVFCLNSTKPKLRLWLISLRCHYFFFLHVLFLPMNTENNHTANSIRYFESSSSVNVILINES